MTASTSTERELTDREGAVRALLTNAVDYAGLFPPAALSMVDAVQNYAQYLAGPDAWALGRFVVPIARLQELETAARDVVRVSTPWRICALAGADGAADAHRVAAFNRAPDSPMLIDVIEARAQSLGDVAALRSAFEGFQVYVELPLDGSLTGLLDAVGAAGLRAKIRTGGVVPDAFPPPASVARFILECVRRHVPFKATAGLHHPLRGEYPLTYAPDSVRGTMYGFVNVFAATAAAVEGADEATLVRLLEARAEHGMVRSGTLQLAGVQLSFAAIMRARHDQVLSFGSCSFREPVDELLKVIRA